jgi:hypothetical protein
MEMGLSPFRDCDRPPELLVDAGRSMNPNSRRFLLVVLCITKTRRCGLLVVDINRRRHLGWFNDLFSAAARMSADIGAFEAQSLDILFINGFDSD